MKSSTKVIGCVLSLPILIVGYLIGFVFEILVAGIIGGRNVIRQLADEVGKDVK